MSVFNLLTLPLQLAVMDVVVAILIVTGIAIVMGALILIVFHFFSVQGDTREEEIVELLPGVNCGGCGYSGCQAYAAALASEKDTDLSRCTAGGQETANSLAHYFGHAAAKFVPKMAIVHCQGSQDQVRVKYQYTGSMDCRTATELFGGPGSCAYGCLGYGDCYRACKYDAITIDNGLAHIHPEKCIACGACVKACPRHLIQIEPKYSDLYTVRCMNPEPGASVRQSCNIGCIGCGLCVKNCPSEAIHMEEKRAVIDVDKCTHCNRCYEVCPTKAIVKGL
ncbi:MAG: RnfABCDGE type electron transport complex subunit B [Eubacteriales bacterium]|nr:RnfABCDGE type electron transport complex subunit B [Eubacteriales bacterium]